MKKIITLFAIFSTVIILNSCSFQVINGNGNIIKKDIPIDSFNSISVEGNGLITIIPGSSKSLSIETDENILQNIKIVVVDQTLKISHCGVNPTELKIIVGTDLLKELEVNGSTDVLIKNGVLLAEELEIEINGSGDVGSEKNSTKKLDIEINGSGDVKLFLDTDKTEIEINGSGSAEIIGNSIEFEAEINGSGDIVANSGLIEHLMINIAGSGSINANVTRLVEGEIIGSGNIILNKDTKPQTRVKIIGSGNIIFQ